MDDNKKPLVDENEISNTPPVGDVPPVPPVPTDAPPLPPLTPDEVKVPTQPLPKNEDLEDLSKIKEEVKTPVADEVPIIDSSVVPPAPMPEVNKKVNLNKDNAENATELPKFETPPVSQPTPEPVPELSEKPQVNEKPIETPKKEEMPVEAEFPGQPLPKNQQQDLEKKAKEIIEKDGGVKDRKVEVVGKPKGNAKKTLVGMLLFVLLGAGAFAGTKLVGQSAENRSRAGITEPDWCPSKDDEVLCDVGSCQENNLQFCTKDPYKGCNWPCSSDENKVTIRVNCCDGKWYTWNYDPDEYGENKAKDLACTGHGGWKNCNIPVVQCTCESWGSYVCGLNCRFPEGTAGVAQNKADSLCKPIIAMCDISTGNVSYEVFTDDHKCRGHVDECNNPVAYDNCGGQKVCNESCDSDEDCDSSLGLTCDQTSGTCRDSNCPTSENCVCPEGDIICNSLVCDYSKFELGESYTFRCDASVTGSQHIETYDFRYQRNTDGWVDLPAASVDSNISSELFIENPGNYMVECRACEDRNDKTKCTLYQVPDSH